MYSFNRILQKQKRTGIVLGLLSAGLVVFDAVMDTRDFNDFVWTKSDANKAFARDLVTMTGLAVADVGQRHAAMTARKARADLYFIGDEILRPELLAPGSSIRGKVFFPVPEEKYIKLIIPLDGIEYAFDFRWATDKELIKVHGPGR